VLAATLPILITIAARPAMYNGIRHFVFVVPPFAVLGGLAGAWIARRLNGSAALRWSRARWSFRGSGLAGHRDGAPAPYEYTHSTASPAAWPERGRASCSIIGDCR